MVSCDNSQRIAQKLAEWVQTTLLPTERLTPQETNVLCLLARGKTDAEILAELGIAPRTLRHHLQNAMMKIGVQEKTQAVLWALEQDLGGKRLREAQVTYATPDEGGCHVRQFGAAILAISSCRF